METKYSYIYKVTNIVNGKAYIGQSVDPIKRINQHIRYSGSGSYLVHYAVEKYGVENFLFEVIKSEVPIEQINEIEIQCIKEHNCKSPLGYNLTDGGEGTIGVSDETRMKLSRAGKGRILSEETKQKMSIAQKLSYTDERKEKMRNIALSRIEKIREESRNRVWKDESRKKVSDARKGKPLSEEHKEKLRQAKLGKPGNRLGKTASEETRQKLRNRVYSDELRKKMSNSHKGKRYKKSSFKPNQK